MRPFIQLRSSIDANRILIILHFILLLLKVCEGEVFEGKRQAVTSNYCYRPATCLIPSISRSHAVPTKSLWFSNYGVYGKLEGKAETTSSIQLSQCQCADHSQLSMLDNGKSDRSYPCWPTLPSLPYWYKYYWYKMSHKGCCKYFLSHLWCLILYCNYFPHWRFVMTLDIRQK